MVRSAASMRAQTYSPDRRIVTSAANGKVLVVGVPLLKLTDKERQIPAPPPGCFGRPGERPMRTLTET